MFEVEDVALLWDILNYIVERGDYTDDEIQHFDRIIEELEEMVN